MKYICDVCGWEYDEAVGDPEHGIAPGTSFDAKRRRKLRRFQLLKDRRQIVFSVSLSAGCNLVWMRRT